MKNKTFATLPTIMLRFLLLAMLLFTFGVGKQSIVHAQGATTEAGVSTAGDGDSVLIDLQDDGDCRKGEMDSDRSDSEECDPRVRVTAVWTADGNLNPKTSFLVGEPIQWVITLQNNTGHKVSVELTYSVKDPGGKSIRHSQSTVSAGVGKSDWALSDVVPSKAGTYTFTGSAEYRGSTTRKQITFSVDNPCFTLATNSDPGAGGMVSASPAPDCNGGTQYTSGTVVTLTAIANTGYVFSTWGGATTGSENPTTLTLTRDETVTANFVAFTGLSAGLHDDTNPAWIYTGDWSTATNPGYHNGTTHVSTIVGNSASVTINGSQFTLYFTSDVDHGSLDVYVDNIRIDTIDQQSVTTAYQSTWTSTGLAPGIHTLKFVHVDGGAVDIDAIQIGPARICDPPTVVSAGTYDDTDCNWVYSGTWTAWTGNGPANGTMHYTNTPGDYAELQFNGTRFILTFTKFPNRGSIGVYVDGTLVETINAFQSTLTWQATYTSPSFAAGNHTVRFVHAGGDAYIDVDTIAILP